MKTYLVGGGMGFFDAKNKKELINKIIFKIETLKELNDRFGAKEDYSGVYEVSHCKWNKEGMPILCKPLKEIEISV